MLELHKWQSLQIVALMLRNGVERLQIRRFIKLPKLNLGVEKGQWWQTQQKQHQVQGHMTYSQVPVVQEKNSFPL